MSKIHRNDYIDSETLKPSVIPNLNYIYDKIKEAGLTREDIILLLQAKTKLNRKQISAVLDALMKLEKRMIEAESRRE